MIVRNEKQFVLKTEQFKELDKHAVEKYHLPIEVMMENAGLQLSNVVIKHCAEGAKILIGVGNGNNGGGGLVAARRLCAWGFDVYLDIWGEITKPLPKMQLDRALSFGVKRWSNEEVDVWVDAYLGFSQRLPLPQDLKDRISKSKTLSCLLLSLDIPVGFSKKVKDLQFEPDILVTLAAPKVELEILKKSRLYVADLGIPSVAYQEFKRSMLPFHKSNVIQINRSLYIHEHVEKIREVHKDSFSKLGAGSMVKFLKSYANDLREGFLAKVEEVAVELSNYYKPLIGTSIREIFRFDLSRSDFNNAAAAIHGFESLEHVKDVVIDASFELAVDALLEGDYYGLKQILDMKPHLINQHSQFGHRAQLIHYCSANAVEMYRQVVPDNLPEMIQLLIDFGANPNEKIPVYGGKFDFFELFSTSAHPKEAKVVKKVERLFK